MAQSFPLQEFVEIFPPPQSGRIVEAFNPDFDAHEAFNIPRGSVLKFQRKVNPNVPLSFKDSWGGDNWNTITLPLEFPGRFKLLPYDPQSGDMSGDHIYHTVQDLVEAFPVYVQANSSWASEDKTPLIECGDRLKLNRLVYKNGAKQVECCKLGSPRLKLLPMDAVGDFTVLPNDNEYSLADFVSMLPRRRRVQVAESEGEHKIPGLPSGYQGDIFVEEAESFVEASLPDGLIIGLPSNIDMDVTPDDVTFERGQCLNTFCTNNRNLFPVVARIIDWDEETTILENHFIKPGVELVIHGWTKQSKVLAQAEDKCFAIPLTYQGKFKFHPRQFETVSELEHAYPGNKLVVTEVDSNDFPLAVGDVFRIKRSDSIHKGFKPRDPKFLKCEKLDNSGKAKEVKLPLISESKCEEVLEGHKAEEFVVRDIVSIVTDHSLVVQLVEPSPDQKHSSRDLPFGKPITLCDFVVEPAVYVSVEALDAPAFHIPLRTEMYVSFVEQLEKSLSPLLTKRNPKLSTLDRCVEIVPQDVFVSLRPHRAMTQVNGDLSPTENITAPQHWQATAYHASYEVPEAATQQAEEQLTLANKWESESEYGMGRSKAGLGAKLKGKFRRHKSAENLSKNEEISLSLPPRQAINPIANFNGDEEPVGDAVFSEDAAQSVSLSLHSTPPTSPISPNSPNSPKTPTSPNSPKTPTSPNSPPFNTNINLQTVVPPRHVPSRSSSVQDVNGNLSLPHRSSSYRQNGSSQIQEGAVLRHAGSLPSVNVSTHYQPKLVPIHIDTEPVQHGQLQHGQQHQPQLQLPPQQQFQQQQQQYPQQHHSIPNSPPVLNVSNGGSPTFQIPPGFGLISLAGQNNNSGIPPGYALVPMMPQMYSHPPQFNPYMQHPLIQQNGVKPSQEESSSDNDDYDDTSSNFTLSRTPQSKVSIPPDGNLYHFSVKKMAEFLRQLKLEPSVVKACVKSKVDGKKFSQLMEFDMERLGLLHPVVIHFRRLTFKKKSTSSNTTNGNNRNSHKGFIL